MKEILWSQKTLQEVQDFPEAVRKEVGYLLYQLQKGMFLNMPQSKPMSSVHKGCHELRVRGENGHYRVFYFFLVQNHILIFHAFKKKTQKTSLKEIEKARKALRKML